MAMSFGGGELMTGTEEISLLIFLLCFAITTVTSGKSFRSGRTARAIRSEYRQNWAILTIRDEDTDLPVEVFRNNLMISTALLSGLVIAFGLVANAFISAPTFSFSFHMIFVIAVMAYALFYLLIEIRTLAYIPLMFKVDSKMVEKNEGMKKEELIGRLMDNTYDDFSNAVRALFYLIALLTFSINLYFFIVATLALTYLFVRRDLSGKSRIEIF